MKNKKDPKNKKTSAKNPKKFDIISVGSSTVDVFAKTDSELIKIETRHSEESLIAYPAGSKLLINDLEFHVGGGGTNTSVAFKLLGLKSAYLGKIGNDENGNKIINCLKKEKVPFVGVKGKTSSGYSIVLDSIEEDRTILVFKGANSNLEFKELNLKKLKTDWFYFSSMMGKSFKTLEKISEHCKKNNIKLAFNPSNYLCNQRMPYLKKLISNTNILILNDEEAQLLVGKLSQDKLLKALHVFGPQIVVITLGKKGAIASDKKYFYSVKPPKVKVAETAGAGDAFASGFVTGIIKKNNVEFGLKLGTVSAVGCISEYGAKNGIPSFKQAILDIKSKKIKVNKTRTH